MSRHWTFGQKLSAGFAVIIALSAAIELVAIVALRTVVARKDRVINVDAQLLIDGQRMQAALERKGGAMRAFLLTREGRFMDQAHASRAEFYSNLERVKRGTVADDARRLIAEIERAEVEHHQVVDRIVTMRRADAALDVVIRAFDDDLLPRHDRLEESIRAFIAQEERTLEAARNAASEAAASAIALMIAIGVAVVAFAAVAALVLARSLGRQVGGAVSRVQSSSAELQAAANQQATGAKQQATAMSEITTTISELLATSRQINESAQRVAHIAEQTASAARSGDGTVVKANDAIGGIRRQVDQIVSHMLELGKKSQQIGAVLDIVSELAEQTNILAINATIEAVGAGDSGKRFGVVAEEIRKLADRVTGSAKEIRGLIDEVRGAVNTTVMATETGSKAVDAGLKHFTDVAAAFKHIGGMVSTTTEAGREIELSTKQQTTAVEQVNVAIANVAQATRETEASSGQTLQTASQLATLSRDLLRLVQPRSAV